MAPHTWAAIPASNTLADLNPKNDPAINPAYPLSPEWSGGSGFPGIIIPWCGAAWADERSELRLPLQGGHGNYAGNEPYAINLNVDAPAWRMLRPPSGGIGNVLTTDDGQEVTGNYADGRPRAIHSYNKHVYVPGFGFVMAVQGNTSWTAAAGTNRTMLQDDDGEWSLLGTNAYAGETSGGAACYDSIRHGLWWFPQDGTRPSFFDIDTATWSHKTTWEYFGTWGARCAIHVPELDLIVTLNVGGISVWNIANGQHYEPTLSGDMPEGFGLSGYTGAAWVSAIGALCLWHNASNTTAIATLTPGGDPFADAWTWGALPVATENAVTPSVSQGNGTYGRFFYSRRLRGFGVLNGVTEPIYFYALS